MGSPTNEGSFAATAIQVARNLACKFEPVIKRQGIFVGKFATRAELVHHRNQKSISAYLVSEEGDFGGGTSFDVMLKLIMQKFKKLDSGKKLKKELVIHLITDLLMGETNFKAIIDRNELKTLPSRISWNATPLLILKVLEIFKIN